MNRDDLYTFTHQETETIEKELQPLAMHALERLSKAANRVIDKKYGRHDHRHYLNEHVPETFNDKQLVAFFDAIENAEHHRIFLKQFFYALRISEICHTEIIPGQDLLRIHDEKEDREDYLPIIEGTRELLEPFNDGKGYATAYIEKIYREIRKKLGPSFTWSYGSAKDGRPLYQFHNHGIRKTAGTIFKRSTGGDMYKVHAYLRHDMRTAFGSTAAYVEYNMQEMKEDLDACFSKYVELLIK